MVFALSPTHNMYHSSQTDDVEHALKVRAEAGNISLGSGSLKIEFLNGLRRLLFTTGSTTTEGDVDGLEMWTLE
jgi:hypothetical protein